MLKCTEIKLEQLSDIDMINFIKSGIRGGISQNSNRYSEANHKYMKNYDPSKQSKYIIPLDANALYSWSQIQELPYGGFRWIAENEIQNLQKDEGYFLEVDLEYPKLHDANQDYPLASINEIPKQLSKLKEININFLQ